MARILEHPEHREFTYHVLEYNYDGRTDRMHHGGGFDCDEKGTVYLDRLQPAGLAHYRKAVAEGRNFFLTTVTGYTVTPLVLQCDCGRRVECDRHCFTITCDCGADYNTSGQRLAPREQWGEETGEHWSECY